MSNQEKTTTNPIILDDKYYDPFLPKNMNLNKGDKVAVAMSGGVDSSVCASLMHEAGYNVIGLTMRLYDDGNVLKNKKACCAGQDIYDAKNVAMQLGFPHYVLDYESNFKQGVIDNFVDHYMKGYTPIPCVRCNQTVKFSDMLHKAKEIGAKALCTGHYIRRVLNPEHNNLELYKAVDHGKDQSYFLFATSREQLDFVRFPLGHLPKSKVREHALRLNLNVANKPDSQDICFVPNGNYADVIRKIDPLAQREGKIMDIHTGATVGSHNGTINYTIGQRKGLGVSLGKPSYVVSIDPDNNIVYLGTKDDLKRNVLILSDLNMLLDSKDLRVTPLELKDVSNTNKTNLNSAVNGLVNDAEVDSFSYDKIINKYKNHFSKQHNIQALPNKEDVDHHNKPQQQTKWQLIDNMQVKIRSNGNGMDAKALIYGNCAIVILNDCEFGVAPGQACVFYDDQQLLGGGWIESAFFHKNDDV